MTRYDKQLRRAVSQKPSFLSKKRYGISMVAHARLLVLYNSQQHSLYKVPLRGRGWLGIPGVLSWKGKKKILKTREKATSYTAQESIPHAKPTGQPQTRVHTIHSFINSLYSGDRIVPVSDESARATTEVYLV